MRETPEKQLGLDEWIDAATAAQLMRVNRKFLLAKDATGGYAHLPELARIQWRAGAKVFFLRSQVLAWRAAQEQAAIARTQAAAAAPANGIETYAPVKDELRRIGAPPSLYRALKI